MIFKILVYMSGIADTVNICPPLQSKYKTKIWQNILLYQNSDYGGGMLTNMVWDFWEHSTWKLC